jgi:hypothetical protein
LPRTCLPAKAGSVRRFWKSKTGFCFAPQKSVCHKGAKAQREKLRFYFAKRVFDKNTDSEQINKPNDK